MENENIKNLTFNPAVSAYHFMQHCYRTTQMGKFTEFELVNFMKTYEKVANILKYRLFDEKNQTISWQTMTEMIIEKYATKTYDNFIGQMYFFDDISVFEMRKAYDSKNSDESNVICFFEEVFARNNYENKLIYDKIEKAYLKSIKDIQNEENNLA